MVAPKNGVAVKVGRAENEVVSYQWSVVSGQSVCIDTYGLKTDG